MKYGNCRNSSINGASGLDDEYAVIHCTGFLRSCVGGSVKNLVSTSESNDPSTYCLVAIGRLQPTCSPVVGESNSKEKITEFISRVTLDGKFTFLDQSVEDVLGYSPKEILGKSCYDFIHPDDKCNMIESYEQVVKSKGQNLSVQFRFRNKRDEWVRIRTICFSFQNPYTDEPEYIVCNNSVVRGQSGDNDYPSISRWVPSQVSLSVTDHPRSSSPNTGLSSGYPPRSNQGKHFSALSPQVPVFPVSNASDFQPMPDTVVSHQQLPLMNFSPGSVASEERVSLAARMEGNNWCQNESEFDPHKMIALAMDKAPFGRQGVATRTAMDRSPFISGPNENRLAQNAVQFHPSSSSTTELSGLQRVVSGPGARYLDNNNTQMDMNALDGRSLDLKPPIQHMHNAFDGRMARMSSGNPMVQNPSLITSATAMNSGFPYSTCDM